MEPMPRTRIKTSISFAADTIEYLDALAREADRPRSWVAEAIIKQHAKLKRQRPREAVIDHTHNALGNPVRE